MSTSWDGMLSWGAGASICQRVGTGCCRRMRIQTCMAERFPETVRIEVRPRYASVCDIVGGVGREDGLSFSRTTSCLYSPRTSRPADDVQGRSRSLGRSVAEGGSSVAPLRRRIARGAVGGDWYRYTHRVRWIVRGPICEGNGPPPSPAVDGGGQ